jgi:hypothetical protein
MHPLDRNTVKFGRQRLFCGEYVLLMSARARFTSFHFLATRSLDRLCATHFLRKAAPGYPTALGGVLSRPWRECRFIVYPSSS